MVVYVPLHSPRYRFVELKGEMTTIRVKSDDLGVRHRSP